MASPMDVDAVAELTSPTGVIIHPLSNAVTSGEGAELIGHLRRLHANAEDLARKWMEEWRHCHSEKTCLAEEIEALKARVKSRGSKVEKVSEQLDQHVDQLRTARSALWKSEKEVSRLRMVLKQERSLRKSPIVNLGEKRALVTLQGLYAKLEAADAARSALSTVGAAGSPPSSPLSF